MGTQPANDPAALAELSPKRLENGAVVGGILQPKNQVVLPVGATAAQIVAALTTLGLVKPA